MNIFVDRLRDLPFSSYSIEISNIFIASFYVNGCAQRGLKAVLTGIDKEGLWLLLLYTWCSIVHLLCQR